MTISKKNIAAFFLSALIAVPVFFSVIFITEQILIKQEKRELLKHCSLITIKTAAEDITWVDDEKQVIINGHYFDVAFSKINGSNITLTGVFDNEEDELVEILKLCNNTGNDSPSPLAEFMLKFVSETSCITTECSFNYT